MNKKSDKESLEQNSFDSLSVYHSMQRLLMAKAKEVSAETDPKALENLRFYRDLDSKLQTRSSLTTAQIHSLNSLFTHFVNHALAGNLHEIKGVLHLAYYVLLNIATTLTSKNQEHQKLAASLALTVTNLMTNILKSLKDQLEGQTRPDYFPGFDKVEWVILRLFKVLTSSTSYGNQLLLFRNRALDKKYVYGGGQFKFEREVGLVFQVQEKQESKSEQSGFSSLDALLSDFTGSHEQARSNNLRTAIESHMSSLQNLDDKIESQISAVAVQKAFEDLCISKTCKQVLQKSRFYVSLFAYFKTKLSRAQEVPGLLSRLRLNTLVNLVTFVQCKLTVEPFPIQDKFKQTVTKSLTSATKEFLVFFVNQFAEKALKKAFVETTTDIKEFQAQMAKQMFELLELAYSYDVDVGEIASMVVEEVLPTIQSSSDTPQLTVMAQCNLVVNTVKLLKSLVLFKLMPTHVKNFIEVVASFLISKKQQSDAPNKIRDHPFKEKKTKRQWGNKQEPKSAIPAVGSASFGPKIEEVKEKDELDADFSSDEYEWEPVLPSNEEELGNLKANICSIVLSFLSKNSLRLHFNDIQATDFKQILTLFNRIQVNVPSSMAALNLHNTLRSLSFGALNEVCIALKSPEKVQELLTQLMCDKDMTMPAKNFALFKLIDLAKREQRYKFPKLFEKLLNLFKVFFEKKEPIGILQEFFTANGSLLLSVLILFRELPRELGLPHAKQIINEIQTLVEHPDTEIGKWIMFLQMSFSFELAMLQDLAPQDSKTLSLYFDSLVKTSLSSPGFFITELSKALQACSPLVPIKKRQLKFLSNIRFPHYAELAGSVSRTTPRVDSLMTEYIKQYSGVLALKEESDPLLTELRKTIDMGEVEVSQAIDSMLDLRLEELLSPALNQLEYLSALLLIGLKQQKQSDSLLRKVGLKMKQLTHYSQVKMKQAVQECESAPEKASRAANLLLHSQFSSKIDKVPPQYMKHGYLGSILEDTCNELAHDLKARIETIYDLFQGGSAFLSKKGTELEKLLLALVKLKYIGRNHELTCEIALMQTLCLLAFPPNFTGNFKSLNDFLESEDIEVAETREQLTLAFYEAAHSPTFTFIQFFQFSMHQWLKGISFAKKSIESYGCLKEAHHVSQLLREVREVLLQSEQSTVLLAEWDGVIKNAIKVLEQDILPSKEIAEVLAPSPDQDKNILRFIIRGSLKIPNSLDFAQLLDLMLVYPAKSKLKLTPSKKAEPEDEQELKEDQVTIEKKSNKSIAMSFSFAKPKSDVGAIQVPPSHKPMQSKFMAHLKAKDKRPQLVQVEKSTRSHLLQVFQRYLKIVKNYANNKGVMDQLKERVCGLDQFQLKQLIYIVSCQEPQSLKKVVFQEPQKKHDVFDDQEEKELFKEFIQQLFPRSEIAKDDPFVLTLLGSLISIAGFYFQEEDLREDELEGGKSAADAFDLEQSVFDERKVKALVESKIPELFQAISHLSWAATKEHPQLQDIASTLIETITTNSYSGASRAVMRLILKSLLFKPLLSQSSEHSMLPNQEASESEGEISENDLSEICISGSEKDKKPEKVDNPLQELLAKGFGFVRSKWEAGDLGLGLKSRGTIRRGGLEGLNEKDFKREELAKSGDMCTFAKTKGNYQDQYWYYCQTCGLNGSSGCCSKCVVHCHKGHEVTFSRRSNFFCDCPDNGTCLYFPRGPAFSPVSSEGQPKIPERYKIAMKNYNPEDKDQNIFQGKSFSSIFSRGIGGSGGPGGGGGGGHYRSHYDAELRGLMKQRDRLDRSRKELARIRGERGIHVRGKRKTSERRSSFKDMPESKLVQQFMKESEGNVSDEQPPQLVESSSDSDRASLFSYFERFAGGLNKEDAPPIVVEEHKHELEENIKKEEDLIQTPLQLQPPQFKSGAADYEPPHEPMKSADRTDDPTPSPFLEILIEQSKEETILMSISALMVEALDEARKSVKPESEEQEEEHEEGTSSLQAESAVGAVMRNNPKVTQADLKGSGKKYFIATDKISLKLEQSNPAKQNIVRIMRNRPDFRSNLDYSKTHGFLALAETDRVSFVKPSSMDSLLEKSSNSTAIDAAHYKTVFQYQTGWPVIGVKLNPLNSNFALVYGMQRCLVLVLKPNGPLFSYDSLDLIQEIQIELEIDAFGGELNLISVEWLPGSQTHILVTTPLFMKVYDLSRDIQQPTHYLTLAQGNFSAICTIKEINTAHKYKILAGSEEGLIFSIDITLLEASEPLMDNQFIIVESLGMENFEIPIGLPVLSIRYFAQHGGLLQISWQNGENILGLMASRNSMLSHILSIAEPKENPALKSHNAKIPNMLLHRGPVLSNLTTLFSTSTQTVMTGVWKIPDESTGCILYIKFKGDQVQVQHLVALPDDGNQEYFKPCGVIGVNAKSAPTFIHQTRSIASFEHGAIGSYSVQSPLVEEVKQDKSKLKQRIEADQKIAPVIEKQHLPQSVQLHPILFEGMLTLKDIKSQNVTLSGEISRKWHNSKQAVEQLDHINNSNFLTSNNKEIKIEIQVTGGCVLSGFRLGLRVSQIYTLKMLNRTITIKPDRRFYDIPLCDAEIYYILQTGVSKLELVFQASEDARPDFQLNLLNVFALRKNDFKLQEKQDLVRKFIQSMHSEKPNLKAAEQAKKEKERKLAQREQHKLDLLNKREYFLLYETLISKMVKKPHNQGISNLSMLLPVYLLSKQSAGSQNKDIYSSALGVMPSSRYIGTNNEAESILANQFLSFVLKNESPEESQGSLLKNTSSMLQIFKGKKARRLSKKNLLKIRQIAENHPSDYIVLLGEYGPALISLLQYFEEHSIARNKSKFIGGEHLAELVVLVLELITFYINKTCHSWYPELTATSVLEAHKRILQSGFSQTPEIFQLLQIACSLLLAQNVKPKAKQEVLTRLLTELHTRATLFKGIFQFKEDLGFQEELKCQATKFANSPFRKQGELNFLELEPVSLKYLPFNLNAMLMDALCSSFSPQLGDLSQLSQILQYSYFFLKTEEKVLRPETAEFSLFAVKPLVRLAESAISAARDPCVNNTESQVLYFVLEFLLMLTTKTKSAAAEKKKVEKKISRKALEFKGIELGGQAQNKNRSNSLNTYLCFMLCSQLVQKCNLAEWGFSTLDSLYNWFDIGRGTLRPTEQDGVPTGVEASKGTQKLGKLLKPDINKGQWQWLLISHDKGTPVTIPVQRLTSEVIASNLETRDQALVWQVIGLLTNVMHFESGVGKLKEKMSKDKALALDKFLQVVLPYNFIGEEAEFIDKMEKILSLMVTHSPCDKVCGKAASVLLLEISECSNRGKGKQHCHDLIMRSNYALKISHFNHLSALSQNFSKPFSYQQLLFQVASVQELWKHVLHNPELWKSFLMLQNDSSLILENFMIQGSQAGQEAIEELLAIIAISLEKKKPLLADSRRKKNKSLSRDCSYLEGQTGRLNDYLKHLFRHFANKKKQSASSVLGENLSAGTLIEWARLVMTNYLTKGDRKMRVVASHLVKGIIETLEIQGKNQSSNKPLKRVLKLLLQKFKGASDEGSNSAEMIGLLAWLCLSPHPHFDFIPFIKQVIMLLMSNVKAVSQIIDSHQNLQIYSALHKILGSDAFAAHKDSPMEMVIESEGVKKEKSSGKASQDFLYLLENDPCMRCYEEVKPPFQHHSLSSVKSDVKFTDSSHVVQFKEPLVIKSISIDLNSQRGQMALKTVIIYTNNKIGADITQLKTNRGMWTRKRAVDLLESDSGTKIKFPVPVSAANLMIEFQGVPRKDKSAPLGGGGGGMPGDIFLGGGAFCLRCGRQVEDRHGVCLNCGENAYQCPYCRNINYENPTAFLCNECGLSRYTKFDITLTAKAGSAVETLESQEQKRAMEEKIDQITSKMRVDHKSLAGKRQQLQGLVRDLEQSNVSLLSDQSDKVVKKAGDVDISQMVLKSKLGGGGASGSSNIASQIGVLYTSDCKVAYQRYMNHWTSLLSLRKEVLKFENRDSLRKRDTHIELFGADEQPEVFLEDIDQLAKPAHRTHCFGCNMNFLFIALSFIRQLALSPVVAELMLEAAIVQSLHAKSMRIFSQDHRNLATSALCRMVTRNSNSALQLVSTLESQFTLLETGAGGFGVHSPALLAQYLQDDVQLVIKLISVAETQLLTKENSQAEELFARLIKLFWSVLQKSVGLAQYNGAIADRILTPCLDYLLHSIQKEDMLRQAYSVLKGNEHWGAAPDPSRPKKKESFVMDELAADFQDIEQFGEQMELEGEEINHQLVLSDMAAQPAEFQELAVRDPEAASEVAKQAATEMSEWCKFIKAQTASLAEPPLLSPFQELKYKQSEVTHILEEQSSRDILSVRVWMFGQDQASEGEFVVKDNNWLIECLLIPTSGTVRKLAKSILLAQTANDFELSRKFMNALSSNLQRALLVNDIGSDYFDCFHLFVKQSEEEANLTTQKEYVRILEVLLSSVDSELQRLLLESGAGVSMTNQLSNFEQTISSSVNSGYGLNRMIEMTFELLNVNFVRDHFKSKESSFVKNLIKSHLKVKKLASVMKNASISQCQKILEKMFNTLRSEGISQMSGFIFECMRILSEPSSLSGIDRAESMYLMEEVRKIIDPEKPEPVYLLNLHKAPSQDVYIRGKMTKNPYSSKDFLKQSAPSQGDEAQRGPLMRHVRDKVCHELEIGADLMELLVDNKIIDLDIPIRLVYEKAWWPALCRKKNPDIQRIPPISQAGPGQLMPMVVIFRLTGLDGEATQDRIESLPDDSDELDGDLEKKYELAQVLSKKFIGFDGKESSGITILLERVKSLEKDMPSKDRYYSESLLKMLELCCRIKVNRQSVIKLRGTKLLIHKLIEMLPRTESSGLGMSPGKNTLPSIQVISDLLLLTLENILIEESETQVEIKATEQEKEDARSVEILTDKLSHFCKPISRMTSLEVRYKKAITRILPYVTFGDPKAIATLLQSFIANLEFTSLDLPVSSDPELTRKQFYTESFIDLVQAIPEHYEVFKEVMVRELGVLDLIDAFFKQTLLQKKAAKFKIKKLTDAVLQPFTHSLTAMLKILLGLCKCSPIFQSSLYKLGHIAHIYKLSETQLSTQRELAVWADKLIKLLSTQPAQLKNPKKSMDQQEYQAAAEAALKARKISSHLEVPQYHAFDSATYEYVNSLIEQTQAKKKKRAAKKKEAALRGMSKPDKVQVNKLFGIEEEIIEEKGLKCIICHEGYSSNQSKNILGIYVYMEHLDIQGQISNFTDPSLSHLPQLEFIIAQRLNKEQLGLPATGSMLHKGFTTVSYFTCIHSHCHRAAYETDKNLSQPKKEWEGARIRNSHTKCNSLLPVWGTPIPPQEYRKHLDKCFSYIGSQIGATEIMGSGVALFRMRFKMLVHDIRCLLLRFALEESFSFHSKGGGPEHNLNYLPYLMQAAYFTYSQLVNEAAANTGNIQDNQFRELTGGLLSLVEEGTAIAITKSEDVKQQQESKEEAMLLNALKTVNIVNSGFYLVVSLLFSSEKEWRQEVFAWLDVAVTQARNQRFLLAGNSQNSEFIGVKAPVVLKELGVEEATNQADQAALKCLRPALLSLVLVDIIKRKFDQILETTPNLSGEHQNKMKDLLKDHNYEVLKVTEQLPKDYKEVSDFSQISHFLKKLEIDNPQKVEKIMMEKLRLKL